MKYNSIPNYSEELISSIKTSINGGFCEDLFSVREKIHGVNFTVTLRPFNTRVYSSRLEELHENSDFHNWQEVIARYEKAFERYQNIVDGSYKEITFVFELAGGKIQRKSPNYGDVDMYLIDINVNGEYMYDNVVTTIARTYGFKTAPLLHVGTLDECMSYHKEFNTNLPYTPNYGRYGDGDEVPVIEKRISMYNENVAEGIVIKSVWSNTFATGKRIIYKYKSPKYSECKKHKQVFVPQLNDLDKLIFNEYLDMLNENRYLSAISKRPVDPTKWHVLINDVIVDIKHDNKAIDKATHKKVILNKLRKLVKQDLKEIFNEIEEKSNSESTTNARV